MEKKLRAKLEEELNESRQGNKLMNNVSESNENFDQLRHKLNDYEEKVNRTLRTIIIYIQSLLLDHSSGV